MKKFKMKKFKKVGVRFSYRNEESYLCLGLLLARKLRNLKFRVSMFSDVEDFFIEITSNSSSCVFGTLAIDTILDTIKEVEKIDNTFFYTIFDVKEGKPFVLISCNKDNNLPF